MSGESDEVDQILSDLFEGHVPEAPETQSDTSPTLVQTIPAHKRGEEIDDQIDRIAANLDIPANAVQMAKSLRTQYREARGDLIGTSLELVAASTLYCACKLTEHPLDPTDFAELDEPLLTRTFLLRRSKDIASTVGLDPSAFFGSSQYVERYCDELDLGDEIVERATEILEITEDGGLASGKSPTGWAAAAVYNACLESNVKCTQSEISRVANVSEVTIRNRYPEQREFLIESESAE